MSDPSAFLPAFVRTSRLPEAQRKRIARYVKRRCKGLPYQALLERLAHGDAAGMFETLLRYDQSIPHVEAVIRNALRVDHELERLGPDLRERGLYELPVLWQGSLAYVLIEDHGDVLVEVVVSDDRLTLLVDGRTDVLFELEVDGSPGQYIDWRLEVTDRTYDVIGSWAEQVHSVVRDCGYGPVLAEARRRHLDLVDVRFDRHGKPTGFSLTSSPPVHYSRDFGWAVGEVEVPGGLEVASMGTALLVAAELAPEPERRQPV
jgi:hypothetical protein